MQQPLPQEVVSPSFLIDIFDRFISKTFENDSNYSFLSKEWNNFRAILSKGSLDLEQVFRYIAQLQLNIGTYLSLIYLDQYNKNPANLPQEEKLNDRNTVVPQNSNSGPNNDNSNGSAQLPPGFLKQNPFGNLDGIASPSIRTEMTYASPTVLARNYSGPASFQSKQNTLTGNSRAQLSFLAEKAKSLKQNIQAHTNKLAVEKQTKPVQNSVPKQDERSQLRKVVLYAKAPNFHEVARNIDAKISNKKNKDQNETFVFC